MTKAKGWTHPNHWKVATVGTVCQILAFCFIVLALHVIPFFTDNRSMSETKKLLRYMDIKCEVDYCYDSMGEKDHPPLMAGQRVRHVFHVMNKPGSAWLSNARVLLVIGAISNLLSLVLILFVFWPVVCSGKVLNIVLHICRIVDFFGAPTKFLGAFVFIWHISDINESYSWWKYDGLLQLDPLPLGFVLFSYILQTLSFVCATLATDLGAKGQPDHLTLAKQENLLQSLEMAEPEDYKRISYHPLNNARSSKLLADVADRLKSTSSVHETNV